MPEPVDYNLFKNWANEHFDKMIERNGKIRLKSIFCDSIGGDKKHHLYCKPSIGYFKCMKSGTKGTLCELVMKVEECSFDEAVDILGGEHNLRYFESKIEEYLNVKPHNNDNWTFTKKKLELPPNTFLINNLGETNHFRIKAENYLRNRKIPNKGLMICVAGEYANRIIIPYYNRKGDLVYWNGRDLGNSPLRYRGPDSTLYPEAKKEEVVWIEYFPKLDTKIYLTEGEFDAMALNECGLHAAAFGGASFNLKQFEMLKGYQLVLSFDADKAGEKGLMELSEALKQHGFDKLYYVRPPTKYKDWNAMLMDLGKDIVNIYIKQKEESHQFLNNWNILKLKTFKM